MAAGLGLKTFVTGDVLTAADTNGYLMQGVWVFADAAARTAAVTSPQEGNMSYLKDTNSTEYYSGSAWVAVGAAGGGMTQLASGSLSGSSVSLTSISQSYINLFLVCVGATPSGSGDGTFLQVNATGNNNFYTSTLIDTTLSIGSANQQSGVAVGSALLAQHFIATIFDYTLAGPKQYQSQGYTVAGSNGKRTNWGAISGTGAITSIQIGIASTFSAGTYKLYGVK